MNEQIKQIIEKYLTGKTSDEETIQLDAWYHSFDERPSIFSIYSEQELKDASERMFKNIVERVTKLSDERDDNESNNSNYPTVWKDRNNI